MTEFAHFGSSGTGAGQLEIPRGVATDPTTGDVYVAEDENARVSEFSPWGEFREAWGWGVRDGASEAQVCGPAAPGSSPCRAGIAGSGPGQFGFAFGIAVDSTGAIYVADLRNARVEKFSAPGQFELMFGGGVDETSGADICTAASGDTCGAGVEGTAHGEFAPIVYGSTIATGPGDTVVVGDKERIQRFEADGSFISEVALGSGEDVKSLAVDPVSGDAYVVFSDEHFVRQEDVHRIDAAGTEVGSLPVQVPDEVATDADGNVYVAANEPERVLEFDSNGAAVGELDEIPGGGVQITGLGTNVAGDLYVATAAPGTVAYVVALGPPPLTFSPPPTLPSVSTGFLITLDSRAARVGATINPHYWPSVTFYVEYGTVNCALAPCSREPLAPGAELGAGAVEKPVTTGGVTLAGLTPATTYHYRFVAETTGGRSVGADASFQTVDAEETYGAGGVGDEVLPSRGSGDAPATGVTPLPRRCGPHARKVIQRGKARCVAKPRRHRRRRHRPHHHPPPRHRRAVLEREWLDLSGDSDLVEANLQPDPPNGGKQAQGPLFSLSLAGAQIAPDAKQRSVSVTGASLTLTQAAADQLNKVLAPGKGVFSAGEALGSTSFTVVGE